MSSTCGPEPAEGNRKAGDTEIEAAGRNWAWHQVFLQRHFSKTVLRDSHVTAVPKRGEVLHLLKSRRCNSESA